MATINIDKKLRMIYLGRNGTGSMAGIRVWALRSRRGSEGGYIDITPINGKGSVAAGCSIEVPLGQIDDFITLLKTAADHLQDEVKQTEHIHTKLQTEIIQRAEEKYAPNR